MDFAATISAGLIGGAIMAAILYLGIVMMPSQMRMNLFYIIGSMMMRDDEKIYKVGSMAHAVMSIAFALVHVGIYEVVGLDSNLAAWGLLFGLGHYMVVGAMLGMLPMVHPRISSGELEAPGAFALAYPRPTAVGFFMLHLLFGLIVGGLYGAYI